MSSPGAQRACVSLLGVALAFVAAVSHAEELQLGVQTQYAYNSNFFSNSNNEDAANSFQFGPVVGLSDPDGRFRYDIDFNGAYQVYVDQDDVDAWETRLRGRASYEISRRTMVRLTERFRDISNLRFSRQDIALADTALDPTRDRYFRNDLELEVSHEITRSLFGTLRAAHHWVDFDDNVDRNDSQAFEVGGELIYQVTPQHGVGGGISYVDQEFDEALSRLGSRGQYVTSYLTWNWDVTSNIVFALNGGPAWVRSEEDDTSTVKQDQFVGGKEDGDLARAALSSCGPLGGELASLCQLDDNRVPASDLGARMRYPIRAGSRSVGTAKDITFFGGASIGIDLAPWNLTAFYSRRQSTTSGDGLASSLDRIVVEAEWAPRDQRWSLFVAGSFDRRQTLTEATVVDFSLVGGPSGEAQRSEAFTTIQNRRDRRDSYTAITGTRFAFTQGVSGTFEVRYRRTERRDRGINRSGVDTAFVLLTVNYDYDVIRF